jgi:hypothetical protein
MRGFYGLTVAAALIAGQAHAYTLTDGGVTPFLNDGVYSGVAGAVTTTFNDGLLPPNYLGGSVVIGASGSAASPPVDTSYYYTVGPTAGTPGILALSSLSSYFGFYMGSPDDYNSLSLYNGATLLKTYTGVDFAALIGAPANGNQSVGLYVNIFASNASEYFNGVRFSSTTNAFETDNHAVLAAIPEPQTYAMMLAGLGLVGFMVRRRRNML